MFIGELRGQTRRARQRLMVPPDFRQAKVEHFGLAALGDEDVGRLDITVNDALRVRRIERVGNID